MGPLPPLSSSTPLLPLAPVSGNENVRSTTLTPSWIARRFNSGLWARHVLHRSGSHSRPAKAQGHELGLHPPAHWHPAKRFSHRKVHPQYFSQRVPLRMHSHSAAFALEQGPLCWHGLYCLFLCTKSCSLRCAPALRRQLPCDATLFFPTFVLLFPDPFNNRSKSLQLVCPGVEAIAEDSAAARRGGARGSLACSPSPLDEFREGA